MADPTSFCSRIIPTGSPSSAKAPSQDRRLSARKLKLPKYLASARAVATFANSAGCTRSVPMTSQERDP